MQIRRGSMAPALDHEVDGLAGRAAGRQHRVDDERACAGHGRQFVVITPRAGGLVVALQPDVAHAHIGKQIDKRLHHAEPRAQDRHDHQRLREHAAGRGLHRCLDGLFESGQVARRLDGEQQAELVCERTKRHRLGRPVAQVREEMPGERMVEDVERHGRGGVRA